MFDFFLHYAGIPIVIGLVFVSATFIVRIAMFKNPKFDQWVKDVWPSTKQRETIVTVLVIGLFIWLFVR